MEKSKEIQADNEQNPDPKAEEIEKLKRLDTKLELIQQDIKINKENTERNKTFLQNVRKNAREKIRKFRVEVNNFCNKLEGLLDKEIEQIRSDDLHKLTVLASECNALDEKVEKLRKDVEESVKAGERLNDLADMEKVKKEMYDMETSIRTLYKENNVNDYHFEPAKELVDMMKHVKHFGTLQHEKERKKVVLKLSETRFNDKSEEDKVIPFLSGLEFISDDHLVAADYENRCLKLIQLSTANVISIVPMNTEPWDVTKVKQNLLAVTLPIKKKIQFFSFKSTTLTKAQEVEVNGDCRGIQSKQDKLFVTFVDIPKVQMLDLHGNVLKCFQFDQHQEEIFSWPGYVAVSPEQVPHVFVTDKDKECVFRLSMDGKVEDIFSDERLRGPRGVAVDGDGTVYVNGRASNDLCQLIIKDRTVESLLERGQGLKQPHGIACRGGRVYISSCGEKYIRSWELA